MQTTKQANRTTGRILHGRAGVALFTATATLAWTAAISGCRSTPPQNTPATIIDNNQGADPADANLAPVGAPTQTSTAQPANAKVRVLGAQQGYTPQQSAEQYPQQQPSPVYSDGSQPNDDNEVNAGYAALEEASQPPPPLPVYEQPPAPEPNDLWTPGYWGYAPQGYYWVPGAWVAAPYAGALWTPGYWGYAENVYRFHLGFWARHIGFYGGVNYGFGYTGTGYRGGYWNGNNFYYNRAVNRVNVTNIHNVYERNVVVNNVTRVSYNGGNGGIQARPGPQELAVLHEQRIPAMSTQVQLRQESAQNRQQFFNQNHGQPAQPFAARPIAAEHGIQAPPAQQPQQNRAFEQRQQPNQQTEQHSLSHPQQPGIQPSPRPQQEAGEAQRAAQEQQQRNAQAQQQQHTQAEQQQRNTQAQQQHTQAEQQQRANQQQQMEQQHAQQQRSAQQQPHVQQLSPRLEPMQRPAAQPQAQAPHPQAQPRSEPQPREQSQPHVQAPQPPRQEAHPQAPHPEQHPNEGRPPK